MDTESSAKMQCDVKAGGISSEVSRNISVCVDSLQKECAKVAKIDPLNVEDGWKDCGRV